MNKNGHAETLVAAHPGNTSAVKYGVHSPRVIQTRADEIVAHLLGSFDFSVAERIAVEQVASSMAILEALDRDLDERGLVDKRGQPRYLLNHRSRISRQLEHWLSKITPAMERQGADEDAASVGRTDYVRELQWIGLAHDSNATARDRVSALKELLGAEAAVAREHHVTVIWHEDEEGNEYSEVIEGGLNDHPDLD